MNLEPIQFRVTEKDFCEMAVGNKKEILVQEKFIFQKGDIISITSDDDSMFFRITFVDFVKIINPPPQLQEYFIQILSLQEYKE